MKKQVIEIICLKIHKKVKIFIVELLTDFADTILTKSPRSQGNPQFEFCKR